MARGLAAKTHTVSLQRVQYSELGRSYIVSAISNVWEAREKFFELDPSEEKGTGLERKKEFTVQPIANVARKFAILACTCR